MRIGVIVGAVVGVLRMIEPSSKSDLECDGE